MMPVALEPVRRQFREYVYEKRSQGLRQPQLGDPLTDRQLQIMRSVAQGIPYRVIGNQQTVKNHMASVRAKLGAQSQAHAVAILDDTQPGWR